MNKLMKNRLVILLISLTLVTGLAIAGCAAPAPEPAPTPAPSPAPTPAPAPAEKITMDFCTIGSRSDGSWSQDIYESYLLIKEKYGDEVECTFTDLVEWDAWPTYLELQGERGADMIFGDSAETPLEGLLKVAPKYPNTYFVNPVTGQETMDLLPDNCVSYYTKTEEQGGFLAGVAGGMKTETNLVGFIAGMNYPDTIKCGMGFELGAKWINPDVEMMAMYTGDWVDVEKGYETARAMLEMDVDVVIPFADNSGLGVI